MSRRWIAAALLWLCVVAGVAAHQWNFWRNDRLDTDVLALLPENEQAPEVMFATRQLSESASRRVVVLIGAPDWPAAREAAQAWRDALRSVDAPLKPSAASAQADAVGTLNFYAPWRDRLLTATQRALLSNSTDAALLQRALAVLYQPGVGARVSEWAQDPLGLWPQWWSARASETRARPRDGELWVSGEGLEWVVIPMETQRPAFALDGRAVLAGALASAQNAARVAQPAARVLAVGVPLHAEAAAVQASREVNTIGWGSLGAVLLLVWLAFRTLRPIALVALSLLVGTATALSVTALVFEKVHLITLVFGASLVGVAEDYGIHYFASRQGDPKAKPRTLMRALLPGLSLALATSVLAYLVLGLAPFPGLRQMALFSATGLAAAFLTVVCWFPWLDSGTVPKSRFAEAVAASIVRWPRLRPTRTAFLTGACVALLCAAGVSQLRTADDIRQLQNPPAELVRAQIEVGQLLGLPSVAQFYLVSAPSAQEVLAREEALKARLDVLVASGKLGGYSAVSDWVPSLQRQEADARLTAHVETKVLAGVNRALGENLARPDFSARPSALQDWLAHPVSAMARSLWLGEARGVHCSVVLLRGLSDPAQLPSMGAAADGLEGVEWVDKVADVSALLGRYRRSMTALLLAGHVAVLSLLWWRYRAAAWRAWVPTAVASIFTIALLGWFGQPFQLFNVLALVLLLGIGVDYGIFLLEHQGDGAAWLAVVLGAASTWLAFGLLGLSATPALRAFGLTLLSGIGLVWAISPCLRCAQDPLHPESPR